MLLSLDLLLLKNNSYVEGGLAIPISCLRVGKMVKAKKDTYKRVYRPDGSYHYPKTDANKLRIKGNDYWQNFELNGSKEGTEKKPKISLLKLYEDIIVPDIERKVVDRFSEGGKYKVIIVKQEDSAGLHQDKTYVARMEAIFKERDWILFNQPSQSLVTNVHDSCIFPMMSKYVSNHASLNFGSRVMKMDELHKVVMDVWNDKTNIPAMSWAFCAQPQIVAANFHYRGHNTYLSKHGGMHFGIRNAYVNDTDVEGGVVAKKTCLFRNDDGDNGGENLCATDGGGDHDEVPSLKFRNPDLRELPFGKLTTEMRRVLGKFLDTQSLTPELAHAWNDEDDKE